jgi:SAM-dependent methyltransferase
MEPPKQPHTLERERDQDGTDLIRHLDKVYTHRFPEEAEAEKDGIWQPIVRYLQRYVDPGGPVLDIGCDRGHFIRNIQSAEKWATDIRDVGKFLPHNIRFRQGDGLSLTAILPGSHFDAVFMSNYLEHLASAEAVVEQLRVARDLLRPGGRAIVLQPNIRLIGSAYWDFIDHKVALTEKSLVEAAGLAELTTERLVTRFLPYTTKSRLPQNSALVRAYLAFPPAWFVLGKQTLYVGSRR